MAGEAENLTASQVIENAFQSFDKGAGAEAASETPAEQPAAEAQPEEQPAEQKASEQLEEQPVEEVEKAKEAEEAPEEEPSEESEEGAEAKPKAEEVEEKLSPEEAAELNNAYREYPQLKEFLKQNPRLRATWHKAVQINKVFPTVQDAQTAVQWMNELAKRDRAYFSPDLEGKRAFLQTLADQSRDASGKPTGHYEAMVNTAITDAFDSIDGAIGRGELRLPPGWSKADVKTAINGLSVLLGIKPLNEALQAAQQVEGQEQASRGPMISDEIAEREEALSQREHEFNESQNRSFAESIQQQYSSSLNQKIVDLMGKADALKTQPEGFKRWVRDEIANRLGTLMKQDSTFTVQLEADLRTGGRGPEQAAKVVNKLKQRADHYLPGVVRQVFQEVGAQLEAKQAAAEQKRNSVPKRKEPAKAAHAAPFSPKTKGAGEQGVAGMKPQAGESYSAFSRRVMESTLKQ